MNVYEKLQQIQSKLKAPKNQRNNFGNYNYRNCEDILESVKPLLSENKCTLVLKDTIELIGTRFYVVAHAVFTCIESKEQITTTAYAREEETKKGMDGSQITGSSSSYARKYALNGLFCIDDTKDSDTTNTHGKEEKQDKPQHNTQEKPKDFLISDAQIKRAYAIAMNSNLSNDAVKKWIKGKYNKESLKELTRTEYDELVTALERAKEKEV